MPHVSFARPPILCRLVPLTGDDAQDKALQQFYSEALSLGMAPGRPGLQVVDGRAHLYLYAETPEFRVRSDRAERSIQREVALSFTDAELEEIERALQAQAKVARVNQQVAQGGQVVPVGMPSQGIPQAPQGPRLRR